MKEGSAAPSQIIALPGRVAVLYPVEENPFIHVPEEEVRRLEQMYGNALECRICHVVSSGIDFLDEGDRAVIRSDAAGLEINQDSAREIGLEGVIPEGYELRIYGVTEPVFGYGDDDDDVVLGKMA